MIFLDETGAKTNFTRVRGWAPKGERRHAAAPFGSWNTTTLAAAITVSGVLAAFAYPGATDAMAFATFVTQVLMSQLRPGDVLLLDNLPAHRHATTQAALAKADIELVFLPPYSPDLNPIENIFSKAKTLIRKASARTVDSLHDAIGKTLQQIEPSDCANAIRHAGYVNKNM